ncbi:MAG: helix-turn-helix transcriptional regulator [Peptococcaceae bacterium]|nr:helix-turn-helix transcriptional regulator [Peptococcaceae bacterium]
MEMKKTVNISQKTRKDKILELLRLRKMSLADLRREAGVSRATMSRLLNSPRGYTPSADTIKKVAAVLDVNPLYLKDENVIGPEEIFPYLTEEDIKFFMDLKNLPFIKLTKEMAEKGISTEDMKKLAAILLATRED